jgi:ubiquinone/menaquinone biosynthesis C-methylase UbiE
MRDYLGKIDQILEREPDPAFARRARIIFENFDLEGKEKVLEVGCGRGFYLKTLKTIWPNLDITGIDINQKYLDIARKFLGNSDVKLINGDATRLPFKDNSFDRIIATEILEHIPDDKKAIAEMYRVLKPDGIAMVTVPNKNYPFCWDPLNWVLERVFHWHIPSNIWWLAGIWADHVRLYDEEELEDKMSASAKATADKEKIGFKVEKVWRATHYCFPFSHFLFYGVGKNLVEKGFCGSFNRFVNRNNQSFLSKILLWLMREVDELNRDSDKLTSMNLIVLARK